MKIDEIILGTNIYFEKLEHENPKNESTKRDDNSIFKNSTKIMKRKLKKKLCLCVCLSVCSLPCLLWLKERRLRLLTATIRSGKLTLRLTDSEEDLKKGFKRCCNQATIT